MLRGPFFNVCKELSFFIYKEFEFIRWSIYNYNLKQRSVYLADEADDVTGREPDGENGILST
jgi:hypothetical protein